MKTPRSATAASVPWWLAALLLVAPPVAAAAPPAPPQTPAQLEARLATAAGGERVELLLQLAEAYQYVAPDKVTAYAQQAYDGAATAGAQPQAARALLLRATGHFQRGDLDAALADYTAGLEAGERLADPVIRGGCLNGIAAVHLKRGELDVALGFFTRAIEQLESSQRKDRLAGALNNVSIIYYTKGRYKESLDYMLRARRLYEETGDDRGLGVVLNSIGNVYNKLDDPAHARETFEQALAIAERTGHKQLIVSCLVNLAEVESRAKAWDAALGHLNKALAIARETGSADFISVCLNNIGDVLQARGQAEEALRFYLEARKMFEAMNARPRLAVSYLNVGRLYVRTGRVAEGEASLVRAFELAGEVDDRSLQRDAAEALVALYRGRGEYERAFRYQQAATDLKEQIFSKENLARISTLQAQYDSEKQAHEIELLRREGEIKELEAKRQRLAIALVAGVSLLLAVLALVLYQRYRLKVRSAAELASAYARMEELAHLDELTGLYNRRSAMERIEIEVVRATRTRRPFGLILLDVDDFKRINDRFGHPCGDAVLRELAALLRATVRTLDVVARWGGEEFLLVLPETGREGTALVAEKVRQAVAAAVVAHGGDEIRFTVTLGVSAFDRVVPVSDCLRDADEALYEGKRSGKNRVVVGSG